MKDQSFNFWQKWLTYANVMTIGVGLLAAFAGNSFVFEMHNDFTKEVFFDSNEFPPSLLHLPSKTQKGDIPFSFPPLKSLKPNNIK